MSSITRGSRGRAAGRLTLGLLLAVAALTTLLDLLSPSPVQAQLEIGATCRRIQTTGRACRQAAPDPGNPDAQQERLRLTGDGDSAEAVVLDDTPPAFLHEIYHADGQKVGEIYVVREPGASTYVEHWVMFDTFEYPDVIRPADDQPYVSEQDFLARVPFGPGYHYARWDVTEQSQLPGR